MLARSPQASSHLNYIDSGFNKKLCELFHTILCNLLFVGICIGLGVGQCEHIITSYRSQFIGSTWTFASRFSSVILLSISGSSRHSNIALFSRVTHTLQLSSSAMAANHYKNLLHTTVEHFFYGQCVYKNNLTAQKSNFVFGVAV